MNNKQHREEIQPEVYRDPDDIITYRTAFCPVCGTSDIGGDVVVEYQQDDEGNFNILPVDYVTLHHALTNVNTAVRCNSHNCGTPSCGYFGFPIPVEDPEEGYRQYCLECDGTGDPDVVPVDEATWRGNWTYEPWDGVYGDLVDALGRPMSTIE